MLQVDGELVDAQGRANRLPPEFTFTVLPNRPPELKLAFPKRDQQVSPIEELSLEATAWDDFGLKQYGLTYALADAAPRSIALGKDVPAKEIHEPQDVEGYPAPIVDHKEERAESLRRFDKVKSAGRG